MTAQDRAVGRLRDREVIPVTVCVVAICENGTIIGASDRMLTAGDIQFEPPQAKVTFLTRSIAIMYAGDSEIAGEVVHLVQSTVRKRVDSQPTNWWKVRDVAYLVSKNFNLIRTKRAEAAILAPLALDRKSYLSVQPELVEKLANEMLAFKVEDAFTIVTGVDPAGPHIYVTANHEVRCQDLVGFAAIGMGYWHADSLLMTVGHTKTAPIAETLLMTYSAKKRAEVAPGVGTNTDMFIIGPQLGASSPLDHEIVENLERIHSKQRQAVKKAAERAEKGVRKYVEEITQAATPEQQSAPAPDVGSNVVNETIADDEAPENEDDTPADA